MKEMLLADVTTGEVFFYGRQLFRRGAWKMDDEHPCSDLVFTAAPLNGIGGLRAIPLCAVVEIPEDQ